MNAGTIEPLRSAGARSARADAGALIIVGIGASAGGLEALERLFKTLPDRTGMAFVVVQHLSPDFKSLMDELLARHTNMAIHRVEDGMPVEADSVYLIPPRKEMIVADGRLLLTDKSPQRDLSLPIDHFFRSLAQDVGVRAVAIVLSGTGSDGSRGIRDVHEAGGLVIVQQPDSAQFDGMPKSAADTGVADLLLTPEQIPEQLVAHASRSRGGTAPQGADAVLDGAGSIFKLLRDEYGIDFSYYKPNTVERRIERRQAMAQLPQLDDYAARLRDDPTELNALYRDLLIGVTRFFRDPEAFQHLERDVLPEVFARRPTDDDLRIWVAGCATGEEAYSLAILLDERMRLLSRRLNVKIFASDAHRSSLEIASAGVYQEEQLADVTPARLERYFVKRPDGWHVSPDLRQMIVFTVHNVIRDAPFTRLDMITCRNLLIYFQQAVQKRVLSLFHFGLRTGGILFLGPSEGPGDLSDEFEDVDGRWKLYRKRRDVRLPADLRLPLPAAIPNRLVAAPSVRTGSPEQVLGLAYETLLERHLPDGVLIDDRRRLVHAFGNAARFLAIPRGRITSDLLDLVLPELRIPLAGALQRALKDATPIAHPPIRVDLSGETVRVRMTVEPLVNRQAHVTHFHVTLVAADDVVDATPAPEMVAEHHSGALVSSLEAELKLTRENLQATVEELETSNEELQASNEELVASNEELQSTNEELHSVNQELYTVNAEYQKKIQELTELTADMDGLLRSTDIGTIFLDENLCIRKFTPQIARTFDLLPHDVGRRIDSFSHNVRYADLLSSLESVLASGAPVEREVQDQHGSWFFLRILPYRSRGRVTGVVLSLIDVSLLKRTEARLEQMSAIVQSSDDAIVGVDLDGRITTWNQGAERLYGHAPEEAIGASLAELLRPEGVAGREAEPDVPPDALARMRAGLPAAHQVETLRRRKDGSLVDVLLSCSAIRDESRRLVGMSIVARDVSQRKAAEREHAERARLTALRADVALALADHENLHTSLQRCTEVLVAHADAAFARIWLVEPGEDVLVLRASAGLYTHLDGAHGRVRVGELKIGRIAASRRPHLSNDVPNDPHTSDPEWARRQRMISFAGYPLVVANRVVGVLAMFGRKAFPLSLLDDLGAISYQIAQCVERKRAEDASRRYAEQLERTNSELRESIVRREQAEAEARAAVDRRDRFLAILSHELRNPLAAVLNAARLLERAGANERVREQAQGAIGRQSRQMARLLDDLLDVSRITRNKIEIRKQVIDLGTAVREACELVRPLIETREHRLSVELPELPVYVDGDPARVQQIAINLLTNAAKYTPPGGAIALAVRDDDGVAELRVRDTGPGIPPAMREKVFDLFFQLEGAVGSSDGGMGVGLTLVRSLIGLHGGTIAIEDATGGGTVFVVRLPLAAEPPRPVAVHGRSNVLAGLHVLVVEDNPDIRTTTVGLLRDFGCVVDSAEDGASGLAALDREIPDVALVDIGMPGIDGYEVARHVRARPDTRRLHLIALTGFGQEDDRHRALEAGFDAHLVKPIDFEQLATLVAQSRR